MSAKPFKASLIPVFIEAENKEELMLKMFNTNAINQKAYNYQTPLKEGDVWVVWYYADIFNDKHVDDLEIVKPLTDEDFRDGINT